MARPLARAPHKTLTLLFLLWIGFDLGAHGIFASDFEPICADRASISLSIDVSGAESAAAPDHCFCHGVSMGAVEPAASITLMPADAVAPMPCPPVPPCDPHRLDRPPQVPA